jgi:hypothetical protein
MSLPKGLVWESRFPVGSTAIGGGFVTGRASIDARQNTATEGPDDQNGKSVPVKTRSVPDASRRITPKTIRGAPIFASSALTSEA